MRCCVPEERTVRIETGGQEVALVTIAMAGCIEIRGLSRLLRIACAWKRTLPHTPLTR